MLFLIRIMARTSSTRLSGILIFYSDISNLRSCDKKNSGAVKVEIFCQVITTVFRRAAALIGTLSLLEEIFSDS